MPYARNLALAAASVALLLGASLHADEVAIYPSADATLLGVAPTNSAGAAEFFIAGITQNFTTNRGLLQFDIASAVPAGARIDSVNLSVETIREPGCGLNFDIFGLHRMLRSWGEGNNFLPSIQGGQGLPAGIGDATWRYAHAFSDPWTVPGGAAGIDYVAAASSQTTIFGLDIYQFEGTGEMLGDVQFWLDHPNANFGWMLKGESEDLNFTARQFASRENPGGGPVLTIDFTPVPEPSTLVLLALGGLALIGVRSLKFRV